MEVCVSGTGWRTMEADAMIRHKGESGAAAGHF